jgi:tetratricopeptide (TPR) repeat protein
MYDEAIIEYSAALDVDSNLAQTYLKRGLAYHFGKELYSRAADDYSIAIALNPSEGDAFYYRGLAAIENGVYEKALVDFSTVIELKPELTMPYYLRAWCHTYLAQWELNSQQCFYQVLASDRYLSQAYRGKSWSYVKQMQWHLSSAPDFIVTSLPGSLHEESLTLSTTPLEPDTAKGKHPAIPYIKMKPLSGPVGTQLFIYGWGFRANEDGMTVTWDDEIVMVNIRTETDGSLRIDGSPVPAGSPIHDSTTRAVIYVPQSTQGTHKLGVYGSSFTPKGIVEDIAFEVMPSIDLSTSTNSKGTQVTVIGTGFAAAEAVTVTIEETGITAEATADENGSFELVEVFVAEQEREYSLKAAGNKGNTAQSAFTIASRKIVTPEQSPGTEEVYLNRGFAHFKKAQWARAIIDLDLAREDNPNLNGSSWDREWALGKLQHWDKAAADYSRIISPGTPVPDSPVLPHIADEITLALADYSRAAELSEDPAFKDKARGAASFIQEWSISASK